MATPSALDALLRDARRDFTLADALNEIGPNHATEFADALADGLQTAGFAKPPGGFYAMWESIGAFREALTDFLAGGRDIAFAGGIAVRSCGARLGPTEDFDLLTGCDDYKALWKCLTDGGFRYVGSFEGVDQFFHKDFRFRPDTLLADSPLHKEALAQSVAAPWRGKRLKIVRPEHLAAMKVQAFAGRRDEAKRRVDRADVLGLLAGRKTTDAAIRDVLARHRPDLLPALDAILSAGS